ncbi:Multidrug/biocide efflux PACE transporter [Pseudomonas sp. IT-P253]
MATIVTQGFLLMNANKTITERIFQAMGFELLAILICTPLLAWIMDKPMLEMGVVTLLIAALALAWNVVFNGLFDRVLERFNIVHNAWVRIVHALLFEGGLVAVGVPLIACWLNISLWQAFLLDIGVLLFFLPYTYVYHWVYDVVRERLVLRESCEG